MLLKKNYNLIFIYLLHDLPDNPLPTYFSSLKISVSIKKIEPASGQPG